MAQKFDAARKEAFLDLIRKGVRRGAACRKVAITRATLSNHLNKSEQFRAQILQAEMDANELVETAMFRQALDGNVTAQQVWLYNRDPEHWQDKRNIAIGGDKNNPIEINLSGDELNAEIKRLVDIASKAITPTADGEGEK